MATEKLATRGAPPSAPPSAFGDGGFGAAREQLEAKLAEEAARRKVEELEREGGDRYAGMSRSEKRAAKKADRQLKGKFKDYPFLNDIRPKERYVFRSDFFNVDGGVGCILGFFHDEGSKVDYAPFWGIERIPTNMPESVSVVLLEQVRVQTESWIEERLKKVETLDRMEENEQAESGTVRTKRKAQRVATDMEIVSQELADGSVYLHTHMRLFVKASDLEELDSAIGKIERDYVEHLGTLRVAPYHSEQRRELGDLFVKNKEKRGRGFHFTSREFAGSYNLVTNGLNDPTGEYVGYMVGDVNTSAVVLDVDKWRERVIVADDAKSKIGTNYVADMWGSKISQAALLNGHRVVHLVLNGTNLDELGPELNDITARMDLTAGDMNMFEMFGDAKDELSIFPQHVRKLQLMVEQAYVATDSELGPLRNALSAVLTEFYVDMGMWVHDPVSQRHKIRIVNIPHTEVPLLKVFVTYLDRMHRRAKASSTPVAAEIATAATLLGTFRSLLENNGDLFNTYTSDAVEGVHSAGRVIYDFSALMARGRGIAMAQLVNVIGFAVSSLGKNDVVVVHGAEFIQAEHVDAKGVDPLKAFMRDQFDWLRRRGGRVAYIYNDVDEMLSDVDFNKFDGADYTVLGSLRDNSVKKYTDLLGQNIPPDLASLITMKHVNHAYLRRGQTNVVFWVDLLLGKSAHAEQLQIGMERGTAPSVKASVAAAKKRKSGGARHDVAERPSAGGNSGGGRTGNTVELSDGRSVKSLQAKASTGSKLFSGGV